MIECEKVIVDKVIEGSVYVIFIIIYSLRKISNVYVALYNL